MKIDFTKKTLGALCALTIIAYGLTGCSSSKETNTAAPSVDVGVSNTSDTSDTAKSDETQANESATKIVSTSMGDLEILVNPQRVISTYGMGDVIALGIIPVATYDATGKAYADEVADVPVWDSFESEEIMTYDPDLILVVSQEQYDEVYKIASTIIVPFTELSMDERVTFLGELLGKEDKAAEIISNFNTKIENAKKELESKDIYSKTFSIFEASDGGGVWVYGDKWGRGGDLLYSHLNECSSSYRR